MNKLETFFDQYITDKSDQHELTLLFGESKPMKAKSFLVKPGGPSSFLAFIEKGTFRVYLINSKGVEVTIWFSFAGMMISDMLSFYKGTSANFYVEAIEDSIIRIISKSNLEKAYQKNVRLRTFGQRYAQNALVKVMDRMLELQTLDAEQRYLNLLEQPRFLEKIPLKYLASFIGITDTSLSRIRRNLMR